MKVVIAGGSGFVGQALLQDLKHTGYETIVLSREDKPVPNADLVLAWTDPWQAELEGATGVVNLSGSKVNVRWTPENRKEILDSRLNSTHAIGQAIQSCKSPPVVWINASAVGIYGNRGDQRLTEASSPGTGFLAEVCKQWEGAADSHARSDTRLVKLRSGIALGKGGPLDPLAMLTKFFLGGSVGDGSHYMSWIHIQDLVAKYRFALESSIQGPLNGTAPEPATNEDFMAKLRKVLHRPWSPPVPKPVIEVAAKLIGLEPELIFEGQRVYPMMAEAAGFKYRFPSLEGALKDLCAA